MTIRTASTPTAKPTRRRPATFVTERSHYGKYYWCIKTELSDNGEIYVHGDAATVHPTGALIVQGADDYGANLIVALAQWTSVYAAGVLDGSAVAVEHIGKARLSATNDPDRPSECPAGGTIESAAIPTPVIELLDVAKF